MTLQIAGMLYNAAWREALIARLQYGPDGRGNDVIRKNLLSWKQPQVRVTPPTRI
jgi:hypothetical protein